MLSDLEAVIFDMDGVLIDSTSAHESAFREVLRTVGVERFDYVQIAGLDTEEAFRRLLAQNEVSVEPQEFQRLVAQKRRLARERLSRKDVAPDAGVVLEKLSTHFALALATSGSRDSANRFLELSGTEALFGVVVTAGEARRGKPAPDLFLAAAERLGVKAAHCAVVEDSAAGLLAASAAGMKSILKLGTLPDRPVGIPISAVIQALGDLVPMLLI